MAAKPIFVQAVDTNGSPYSGAKLYVYDAGTTTPRAIYTESGLGTASANPAIADANGVTAVWVDDAGGDIKIVLTNSAGSVTPHSSDNIPIASLTCYPVLTFQGDQSLLTGSSPTFASMTLGNVSFAGVVVDPDADRLMFWDDSASQVAFMTLGTGLAFNGTALELDGDLQDISGLTPTDGGVIIGDGTDFVVETGATLRASLGLGTGDSVTFAGLTLASGATVTAILDEDGLTSDSATAIPTQQSVKAYADSLADTIADINAITQSDGTLIVSDGTNWVGESGGTLRTSLGLGASDAPTFAGATFTGAVSGTTGSFSGQVTVPETPSGSTNAASKGYVDGATVDTLANLRALTGGAYSEVSVLGHSSAGDGGAGRFVWDAADTTADDDGVYIQPGAGGTGRWIRQYAGAVNIMWFGPAADGTTDDTAVFSAVLNDYPEVRVPAGTYNIDGAGANHITLLSSVRVIGDGIGQTVLLFTLPDTGFKNLFKTAASDIHFQHMTLRASVPASGSAAFFSVTSNRLHVEDCACDGAITGSPGSPSHIFYTFSIPTTVNSAEGVTVADCVIHNTTYSVLQSNSSTATVSKLRFLRNIYHDFYGPALSLNAPSGTVSDVTIEGNTFRDNNDTDSAAHYIGLAGIKQVSIVDNVMTGDIANPIHIEEDSNDVLISGNKIKTDTTGSFAMISLQDNNIGGSYLRPTNVIVRDNILEKAGTAKEAGSVGINIILDATPEEPAENIYIANNIMTGFETGLIDAGIVDHGIRIESNLAYNCTTGFEAKLQSCALKGNVSRECVTGVVSSHGSVIHSHTFIECTTTVDASGRAAQLVNPVFQYNLFSTPGGSSVFKAMVPLDSNMRAYGVVSVYASTSSTSDTVAMAYEVTHDGTTLTSTTKTDFSPGGASTTVTENSGNLALSLFTASARSDCMLTAAWSGQITVAV